MRKLLSLLIFCLFFFNAGFCQITNRFSERPADLKDGIQTSTPAKEGMNAAVINEIVKAIDSGFYPNRHSLLIYKNGKLVLEKYFVGRDQKAGMGDIGVVEHNVNTLHDMRSVSKSVVSACIGIAIARGKIKSIQQKVFTFFPEYEAFDTGAKKDLTIEHLLTMSSGLQWNEDIPYSNPENSEMMMTASKDPLAYIFSQPMAVAPGTAWKYNGGTTQLLAEILRRVTGQTVAEFANENIFKKLGIPKYEWAVFPGTDNPKAASGLRLRPRDMLKFGILYQYGGKWQGQQIIPRSWVEQSFTLKIRRPESIGGYGYQFWIFKDTIQNKVIELPTAVGNGDQRIFFDRKNDLVVVMTAGNYNKWDIKNNA
ncbi:MAG: penicillin-binding protein beta-lactamase class, partial [Segetibacter sp.]|nr:penicillin-binding protein beta-lactamase class [Segetibacter sp.]